MKRLLLTFLSALLLSYFFAGCNSVAEQLPMEATTNIQHTSEPIEKPTLPLQYRTMFIDASVSRTDNLQVTVLRSINDIHSYCSHYSDTCNNNEPYYDNEEYTNLLDIMDRYDEAFFIHNSLILIKVREASSSIEHNITGLEYDNTGKLLIMMKRIVPEINDCLVRQQHILIEVNQQITEQTNLEVVCTSIYK